VLSRSDKIFSIDIDGTLTDYPKPWLNFLRTQVGQDFDSVFSAKNIIGLKNYDYYKHLWRISPEKYSVPVRIEMKELIEYVYSQQGKVYLNTSRPFDHYQQMHRQTTDWLIRNGIRFEGLNKKSVRILDNQGVRFLIDDQITELNRLANIKHLKYLILVRSNGDARKEFTKSLNREVHISDTGGILTLIQNIFAEEERT